MSPDVSATPQPLLSLQGLTVDYVGDRGDFRAVDDVSFDIGRGEVFGLAGESGCGKSTIAFAITRLHKPPAQITGGGILLNGTGWGFGVGVTVGPDEISSTPGRYGWSGGYGCDWFTDPHEGLIAIALTQVSD